MNTACNQPRNEILTECDFFIYNILEVNAADVMTKGPRIVDVSMPMNS